jgi:uncharacterized protein (UPF0254 family)
MIKIATAECFTHGIIGKELHAASRGYPLEFNPGLEYPEEISVVCSMFVPTFQALKDVLKVDSAPVPFETLDGIKVYKEKEDKKVAALMAEAAKKLSKADIGIGTTAGIGRGAVAISYKNFTVVTTSDVSCDFRSASPSQIISRQNSGVQKAFKLLKKVLEETLDDLKDENIEIFYR